MEKVLITDKRPMVNLFWEEVPFGKCFYVREEDYKLASLRTMAWRMGRKLGCHFYVHGSRDRNARLICIGKGDAGGMEKPPAPAEFTDYHPSARKKALRSDALYDHLQRDKQLSYLWADKAAAAGYTGAHWKIEASDMTTMPLVTFRYYEAKTDSVWALFMLTMSENYVMADIHEKALAGDSPKYHKVFSYEEMIALINDRSNWALDEAHEAKKALIRVNEEIKAEKELTEKMENDSDEEIEGETK